MGRVAPARAGDANVAAACIRPAVLGGVAPAGTPMGVAGAPAGVGVADVAAAHASPATLVGAGVPPPSAACAATCCDISVRAGWATPVGVGTGGATTAGVAAACLLPLVPSDSAVLYTRAGGG
uniref:Uncharacterized protein n=1 Tax=Heterosigma akashiwo TaxID=2829 RepID=A0A6V1QCP8_HETAK